MNRKKWRSRLAILLLWLLFLGMIFGTGRLYVCYLQYGEQEKQNDSVYEEEKNRERQNKEEKEESKKKNTKKLNWKNIDLNFLIRVCICTSDYKGRIHQKVVLSSREGFEMDGSEVRVFAPEESVEIKAEQMTEGEILKAVPSGASGLCVESISRSHGQPEYEGVLYLCRSTEGIVLINELPLETYLYSVTASEMPASYPLEAQKAQAVCARTYAVNCINAGIKGEAFAAAAKEWQEKREFAQCKLWDLDDSVEFQVYNNQKVMKNSRKAVADTAGEILDQNEILYYSTSVGSETREDLDTEQAFSEFLSQDPAEGVEYDSPWLRWQVKLKQSDILEHLKQDYDCAAEVPLILRVLERNGQGQVQKLAVVCADEEIVIEGEYWVRRLLAPDNTVVSLRDGTLVQDMLLLPSAYFTLQTDENGEIALNGGGYGHGIGMSQCGAAAMAEDGRDYREILEYYYGTADF